MKRGFTLVEVSILFVIFLIVAFLVAPLSLDDTRQAKYTSKWRNVQSDFANIFYSINTQKKENNVDILDSFNSLVEDEIKSDIKSYKITFLNGTFPNATYRFSNFKLTNTNAVLSVKHFDKNQNGIIGLLLYDVNGSSSPNVWGKDVFGFNIYNDKLEPFGKEKPFNIQKQDCSNDGTGLSCSNYYLLGGSFD